MAKIDLPKRSGKWSKVRLKSVKSQGILKRILSGNPGLSSWAWTSWLEFYLVSGPKCKFSNEMVHLFIYFEQAV